MACEVFARVLGFLAMAQFDFAPVQLSHAQAGSVWFVARTATVFSQVHRPHAARGWALRLVLMDDGVARCGR